MSEMKRLSDRNRAIQEMLTSGEGLKTFYRFVANNPHIALHDACQIVIERPSASICFSFEEWNAQGRRVTKGRKGIPYNTRRTACRRTRADLKERRTKRSADFTI